jgi:hypothetical protein
MPNCEEQGAIELLELLELSALLGFVELLS